MDKMTIKSINESVVNQLNTPENTIECIQYFVNELDLNDLEPRFSAYVMYHVEQISFPCLIAMCTSEFEYIVAQQLMKDLITDINIPLFSAMETISADDVAECCGIGGNGIEWLIGNMREHGAFRKATLRELFTDYCDLSDGCGGYVCDKYYDNANDTAKEISNKVGCVCIARSISDNGTEVESTLVNARFTVTTTYHYTYQELNKRFVNRLKYKWNTQVTSYNVVEDFADGKHVFKVNITFFAPRKKGEDVETTTDKLLGQLRYRFGSTSPKKWSAVSVDSVTIE